MRHCTIDRQNLVVLLQKCQMLGILHLFIDLQSRVSDWLWCYNNNRPNMSLGVTPPVQTRLKQLTKPVLHYAQRHSINECGLAWGITPAFI